MVFSLSVKQNFLDFEFLLGKRPETTVAEAKEVPHKFCPSNCFLNILRYCQHSGKSDEDRAASLDLLNILKNSEVKDQIYVN